MSEQNFNEEINGILNNIEGLSAVEEHADLEKIPNPYFDKYLTAEQKKRDELVTTLLECYVANYREKIKSNDCYKKILFFVNIGIVLIFTIIMISMISIVKENIITMEYMVAFITACVSYLTLVFGIMTIITKYVFPEKEEEYITEIVKTIQENDLKNKQENMRADGVELVSENREDFN